MNIEKKSKVSWFAWLAPESNFDYFLIKSACVTISLLIANLIGLIVLERSDAKFAILFASVSASIGAGIIADWFAFAKKTLNKSDETAEKSA